MINRWFSYSYVVGSSWGEVDVDGAVAADDTRPAESAGHRGRATWAGQPQAAGGA